MKKKVAVKRRKVTSYKFVMTKFDKNVANLAMAKANSVGLGLSSIVRLLVNGWIGDQVKIKTEGQL